jgi:double-stranded uracil-DNA glycosylase
MVGAAKANAGRHVTETLKTGLPPIARKDARLFILGSLPGDASLAAGRYYAHPLNQFWRLLGSVLDEDLHALGYEERLQRLAVRRIGIWDVIGSAVRRGSLDQAIRLANHNRIEALIHDFPALEAIAFNGGTASSIGRRLVGDGLGLTLIDLPSSSPANTRPFAQKAAAWAALAPFCGPDPCAGAHSRRDGGDDTD